MKPLKVFWNGKRLKDIYPHATRWQMFKYRVRQFITKVTQVAFIIGSLYVAGAIGSTFNPQIVYAEVHRPTPPILERIAHCESHSNHYCTAALASKGMCSKGAIGQVLARGNKNKSVDYGKYQINNDVWGAKATSLGFDIYTEAGNEAMARWIFENHGDRPWYASAKCWDK